MADTTELIKYYQDSLLQQWVNNDPAALNPTPKARSTIGILADCAACELLQHDVRDAFDLTTAVGDQLDILGEVIGRSRLAYGVADREYYQADDYTASDPTLIGMTSYVDGSINPLSVMYRYAYAREAIYNLDDESYRFLLQLKVQTNKSDNTLYTIHNLLYGFFGYDAALGPAIILRDHQDMTMSYFVNTNFGKYSRLAASQDELPKPMGVGISGIFELRATDSMFEFMSAAVTLDNPDSSNIGFGSYTTTGASQPTYYGSHFLSTANAL